MKKIAIYIHIPFCKSKCKYCDFASFPGKDDLIAEYIEAVCKEIKIYACKCKEHVVSSIYLGGGTPSYIDEFYIGEIYKTLKENYNISEDSENTIEINPGTITQSKLEYYKELGINRLSFGLQETHNDILGYIGRIHTYEEFHGNYNLAREIGFNNISVDLIFGLPKQTMNLWQETLERLIKLNPEHISAYSLKIEESTKFGQMNKTRELQLPNEEEEREMYYLLKKELKKAGYFHYEISNFGKQGCQSRHNTSYWERQDYFGFGSAAASCFNEIRMSNEPDIRKYIKMMKSGSATLSKEVLKKEEIFYEKIILGLRMNRGIDKEEILSGESKEVRQRFNKTTEELYKKGLVEIDNRRIKLTDRGLDLANYVFVEYL